MWSCIWILDQEKVQKEKKKQNLKISCFPTKDIDGITIFEWGEQIREQNCVYVNFLLMIVLCLYKIKTVSNITAGPEFLLWVKIKKKQNTPHTH